MPSVRLILLITILCSYSYGEGGQHRFRGFQGISPDTEVRAASPSPYKLTYRLISRREFEKLADRPWQPLELQKTPAPVKRLYAVRRVPYVNDFVEVTLYTYVLGNLVIKDEVGRAYEFLGHFRSPFTGELYTFFTVGGEVMMGGGYDGLPIPPKIEIFSRGKLLKNVGPGELFLSPDRRYILHTGLLQLHFRERVYPCQVFPNYKGSSDYFLEGNAPHFGLCSITKSEVIRPTLFDLQSHDLPALETGGNNKEVESLFDEQGNRHEVVRVWGVKDSSKSFILEVKVDWTARPEEGYTPGETMHEKTYYLLFSLEDSGLD